MTFVAAVSFPYGLVNHTKLLSTSKACAKPASSSILETPLLYLINQRPPLLLGGQEHNMPMKQGVTHQRGAAELERLREVERAREAGANNSWEQGSAEAPRQDRATQPCARGGLLDVDVILAACCYEPAKRQAQSTCYRYAARDRRYRSMPLCFAALSSV